MSQNQQVHKFELRLQDRQVIKGHPVVRWLTVQVQHETICAWAVVDTTRAIVETEILILGTGHWLSGHEGRHLGTVQLNTGDLVFHVFEAATP